MANIADKLLSRECALPSHAWRPRSLSAPSHSSHSIAAHTGLISQCRFVSPPPRLQISIDALAALHPEIRLHVLMGFTKDGRYLGETAAFRPI